MGQCAEEGCVEFKFDEGAALAVGWDLVEGRLFCPSHRQLAARAALAKAEWARLRARSEELRAKRHAAEAKTGLSTRDYAKWNEFQQEMTNFHKKHGKRAPAALRALNPKTWLAYTRKNGPVDVELAAAALFEAEKRADETREWLMRRVE